MKDEDDLIDGRWIEAVNCYASTCDLCSELTMHEDMTMNAETQLAYCPECVEKAVKLGLLDADAEMFD